MEDWRGLFRERFVIEENTEEQYLRKHDHRTIVEELEHFIEQELSKAREEGRREILADIWDISTTERAKDINWCGDIIAEWASKELEKLN